MSLVKWDPFREMEDFFGRYRVPGGVFPANRLELSSADVEWRPAADITENDKEYLIKADLPEVKREDVNVALDDGVLTITGERRLEKSSEDEKQHRIEAFYGSFSRSFRVPDDVDLSAISANTKDGVLRVRLPKVKKVEKPAPTRIDVK